MVFSPQILSELDDEIGNNICRFGVQNFQRVWKECEEEERRNVCFWRDHWPTDAARNVRGKKDAVFVHDMIVVLRMLEGSGQGEEKQCLVLARVLSYGCWKEI